MITAPTKYLEYSYTIERATLSGVRAWHYVITRPDGTSGGEGWHCGVREQVIREIEFTIRSQAAKQGPYAVEA